MKYKYNIESENLCPHCATKIEDAMKKIDGVIDVNLSALTRKLRLETTDDADIDNIMEEANRLAEKYEPGTSFVKK